MRRKKAWKRGWTVAIVLAGSIGYLLGGWHAATLSDTRTELSPAQAVALRFPEDRDGALPASAASVGPADAIGVTGARVLGGSEPSLLNPAPMVAKLLPQAATETAMTEPLGASAPPRMTPPSAAVATRPAVEAKVTSGPPRRRGDRAGFVLNDAQIASIKQRLHLTPNQERMWPAVEAALRNLAYVKAREAHRNGAAAGTTGIAFANPESAEVQDLKSAAVPLLMSFSAEQKNEVRSLAHVMGLDQLASEL